MVGMVGEMVVILVLGWVEVGDSGRKGSGGLVIRFCSDDGNRGWVDIQALHIHYPISFTVEIGVPVH